jgi:mono/diheme cytochrome c family protein
MRAWLATTVLVLGCGTARRDAPFLADATPDAPNVRAGQIAFYQHCHTCHPGGAEGLGPAINDKPLPDFAVKTQVRQGMGEMPAFGTEEIPDEHLDAIVAYLGWLRGLNVEPE